MEQGYNECIKGFEDSKRFTENGIEYWMARELGTLLGYISWDKFEGVVEKAKVAASSAGAPVDNHFSQTANMVAIGSGAERGRVRGIESVKISSIIVRVGVRARVGM